MTDILAIDAGGRTTVVTDRTQPAALGVDYHFAFRPLDQPELIEAPITSAAFAAGCPPGHDADPGLVAAVDLLERGRAGADLVRFSDPATGAEQWLGRETPFDPWQTWDDPRTYYPGDPADILHDPDMGGVDPVAALPDDDEHSLALSFDL